MAEAPFPFWLPLVCATASNASLAPWLATTPAKVGVLRSRYGLSAWKHMPKGPLDIDWLQLVGEIPDDNLAKLVQLRFRVPITPLLIAAIRKDLGRSASTPSKPKLGRVLDLIGKHPVRHIARGWNLDVRVVEAYRLLAKLTDPAQSPGTLPLDDGWNRPWLDLFPHRNNAQIARITGFNIDRVRAKRNELSIANPARSSSTQIDPDELTSKTDSELAHEYGGTTATYAEQRLVALLADKRIKRYVEKTSSLPARLTPFLSQISLHRLSAVTGLGKWYLTQQINHLGLERYSGASAELDAQLGTRSDVELANEFLLSRSAVKARRDKLGIAAFKPSPTLRIETIRRAT